MMTTKEVVGKRLYSAVAEGVRESVGLNGCHVESQVFHVLYEYSVFLSLLFQDINIEST